MKTEYVEIYNLHYQMDLGCGWDAWRLYGNVYGHPSHSDGKSVSPSTPVRFRKGKNETDLLYTISGRHYRIMSYDGNKEEIIKQIKKDIKAVGYELH